MATQKDFLMLGIKLTMDACGKSPQEVERLIGGMRRKSIRELHDIWRKWKRYEQCRNEKDWYARMGHEQDEGIADYS